MTTARIAGLVYVVVFVTGGYALMVRSQWGTIAGLIAAACYVAVTILFYLLFTPVDRRLSLAAACVSFIGIAAGPLRVTAVNPLVFFGVYCLLIGYLILRSTFLPRALGALMVFAGLGWLTFLSPSLARQLYPYNFAPGLLGEGALTVWLVAMGVNEPRWRAQAASGK